MAPFLTALASWMDIMLVHRMIADVVSFGAALEKSIAAWATIIAEHLKKKLMI